MKKDNQALNLKAKIAELEAAISIRGEQILKAEAEIARLNKANTDLFVKLKAAQGKASQLDIVEQHAEKLADALEDFRVRDSIAVQTLGVLATCRGLDGQIDNVRQVAANALVEIAQKLKRDTFGKPRFFEFERKQNS